MNDPVPLPSWDQHETNHKDPEQVRRRHEFVLDAWVYGRNSSWIARKSGYQTSGVYRVLDLARAEGDPRAVRRRGVA